MSTRTPPERTQKAIEAVKRKGADRRINELLAVAPVLTDEQLARIASILTAGAQK